MEPSGSLPFKSKKILHSSSSQKPSPSDEITTKPGPDRSPWSSKTPEKPADHPRRARDRRAAFSVKEVREVAEKLRFRPDTRSNQLDPVGSSGQQIGSGQGDKQIGKAKKVDGSIKLPERFEILGKFFDSLDSSIRLLRLKGSTTTFTNITPKVECLTDRRFSYGHLAQLKFLLPEVITMKKVLVHDERTSCMKPDLHITMNVDAIKNEGKLKSANGNSHMRKIFHSRLLDFFKAHPEGEIPEGPLPEPFNKCNLDSHTSTIKASSSTLSGETSTDALAEQQPAAATHLSQSFRKHFSQQASRNASVHSNQEQATVSLQPSVLPVSELHVEPSSFEERTSASADLSSSKFTSKPPNCHKCLSLGASQASVPLSRLPTTPMKQRDCLKNETPSSVGTATIQGTPSKLASTPAKLTSAQRDCLKNETCSSVGTATIHGTPAKLASTPVKLMSATPALRPPKRSYMSPDDNATSSPYKLVTRPPSTRSLIFDSPMKNAKVDDEVDDIGGLSVDDDIFSILPENLLQSIREKERRALEEKDPAISRAKRRQKMIANLPKLFDMIRFLFQSIKHSVVTKEEFMYRIMANHLDIVDRREVEEQLKLLQELVPEWIYEKPASSGDLLICVNKISSPDSMRARLLEAKGEIN